jgi:hypothetical protein
MRDIAALIRATRPDKDIQKAVDSAEFLLENARKAGATPQELARLEELVKALKGIGHHQLRDKLQPRSTFFGHALPSAASEANVKTTIAGLTSDAHWAAEEIRANLMTMIEQNGRIPEAYKGQLRHDVAAVLLMCPHAGGLVRELTLRGQGRATGSASKLGSHSNSGVGAAYEIMGAAALAKGGSKASNGAPSLNIYSGRDIVTFGDKSYMNRRIIDKDTWEAPSRASIECDIRIARPTIDGFREIGVDFKHVRENGTKHSSADLKNQVENVVEAIKSGQLHEYHFVTNGNFGSGAKEVIAQANVELARTGDTPIGIHEYVHTLSSDPTAD